MHNIMSEVHDSNSSIQSKISNISNTGGNKFKMQLTHIHRLPHRHFHCCHSSSPHSFMPVSVNEHPTIILAVWPAVYTGTLNSIPTHFHSFFLFSLWKLVLLLILLFY